jgi:hypothetical protein
MRRLSNVSRAATAVVCALVLAVGVGACGEDGKTTPERCPQLPIFDIQSAGVPSVNSDCVTQPGDAISGVISDAGAGGS